MNGPLRSLSVKQPPADLAARLWAVSDQVLALGNDISVDGVAELTGVPRATLYYYFSGKDDVMAFLLSQNVEHASPAVADAAAGAGSPADRLEAVVRAMLHKMAEHPALCTRLLCWMASSGGEQQVIEAQGSLLAPMRALVAEGQAAGDFAEIDPIDATTALMGAVAMVAMRHTVNGDFDPDRVADTLIPRLLDGLRRHPAPGAHRGAPDGGS